MLKGFALGVIATIVAIVIGGYLVVVTGALPANADGKPPRLEAIIARKALHAAIDRQAPKDAGPLKPTDENLLAGVKVYARNCAICHGAADGKASNIARGLYQHAPQLGKDDVTDDPEGETWWKVDHGIRMTGMPGFSGTLTRDEVWQVTLFLKHMNELTPKAKKAWEALPSQG